MAGVLASRTGAFRVVTVQGQVRGEIDARRNPDDLARYLVTFLNGGRVMRGQLRPRGLASTGRSCGRCRSRPPDLTTCTPIWADPAGPAGLQAQTSGVTVEDVLAGLPAAMGITTGRLTEPEEIADLIVFVASARGGNLTGADLIADGGVLDTV